MMLPITSRQRPWSRETNQESINTSLYTYNLLHGEGSQVSTVRQDNCLSAADRTVDCYTLGEEDVDVNDQVKEFETALLALPQGPSSRRVSC